MFGPVEAVALPAKKPLLDLARLLISKGAKVDVLDENGKTPVDYIKDDVIKAEILTDVEAQNVIGKDS